MKTSLRLSLLLATFYSVDCFCMDRISFDQNEACMIEAEEKQEEREKILKATESDGKKMTHYSTTYAASMNNLYMLQSMYRQDQRARCECGKDHGK